MSAFDRPEDSLMIRELSRNDLEKWMESFRERHGHSPYEVLNTVEEPSSAAIGEAWGAFYAKRHIIR